MHEPREIDRARKAFLFKKMIGCVDPAKKPQKQHRKRKQKRKLELYKVCKIKGVYKTIKFNKNIQVLRRVNRRNI